MPTQLPSEALKELIRLSEALVAAEEAVSAAEMALQEAKRIERNLREQEIPDYMQELGIASMKLESGAIISFKDDVRLEWDHAKKEKAFAWLEAHEFGGLIKTEVSVAFGKGELEQARQLLEKLAEETGKEAQLTRDVHYQTMCAFLREQISEGASIPLEEWGAVSIKKATVRRSR